MRRREFKDGQEFGVKNGALVVGEMREAEQVATQEWEEVRLQID